MKCLNSPIGQLGPFSEIETLDDRYRCDGVEYPFNVLGVTTIGEYFQPVATDIPVPVQESVSPRQIRQAMNRVPYKGETLRQAVEAAVGAADQDTQDWYAHASEFLRSSDIVAALASTLGVSPEELDDLWRLGASL